MGAAEPREQARVKYQTLYFYFHFSVSVQSRDITPDMAQMVGCLHDKVAKTNLVNDEIRRIVTTLLL